MSNHQPTTPYELKQNFKKCPVCKSKNIHSEEDESNFVLTCDDCKSKFLRRVRTDDPKNSEILLYFPKAEHPFVNLNSREVVTFT